MFYKKLNIKNFKEIQKKICPYFIDFISKHVIKDGPFYYYASEEQLNQFKKDLPELFETIREELGSTVVGLGYIYMYGDNPKHMVIHSDVINLEHVKKRIKLNWPILNSDSAELIFYKTKLNVKPNLFLVNTENKTNEKINASIYNLEDCIEVDKFVLDCPTLVNVREVHGGKIVKNNFPRILLSMRLSNENDLTI